MPGGQASYRLTMGMCRWRHIGVVLALALLAGAASTPAPAAAQIDAVFTSTTSPVPCTVQADGVRFCSALPRSTVKTFDGVPIDVDVAFPPAPASGPDGPYPAVIMLHGYGQSKRDLTAMRDWLNLGFAAFSMTDRGLGESCGTQASRDADPAGCQNGYIHFADPRFEVRDAQELTAKLVDEGRFLPDMGTQGAS